MSIEELKEWNPNKFLEHKILEPVPFIFAADFDGYLYWKSQLSRKIEVDSRSIALVGSAAVGFSLNPSKNFKPFDTSSDVDIAIISQFHFDLSWRTIRSLGARYHSLTPVIKASVKDHIERLIYWGTIATDNLLTILPFSSQWNEGRRAVSALDPTKGRDINFRIYKDFESLRSYQLNGVRQAQASLLEDKNV